jgi:MFS family permease
MVYGAAGLLNDGRLTELALLIVGRILMGLGESLFLTGLMTWGIGRLGAARTGVVMSWTGIAIYAAIGLGASAGLACQATGGPPRSRG